MPVVSLPAPVSERRSSPAPRPAAPQGGRLTADLVARALIAAAKVCDLDPAQLLVPSVEGARTPRTINRARKLAALALISVLGLKTDPAARLCGVSGGNQLAPSFTKNITDAEVLSLAAKIAPW